MSLLDIMLKLLLAIALGGIIGLEREASQKPAGLRTHILISVSAAMMMILPQLVAAGKEAAGGETLRVAAAVITGMGFIGAGTIIQSQGTVHGLTTASTLWTVAGLGLVVGGGFYLVALLFALLVIGSLVLFRRVEETHLKKTLYHYHLKIKDSPNILVNLRKLIFHLGLKLAELNLKKERNVSVVTLSFSSSEEKERQFNQSLFDMGEILEIKIE
ncbi:MAG: sapB [Candidatus Aminicenantes bacterium]|jgi:putative Mg2+ transporter-C (MgtC) family protein|nr:sapB [Candidatus Aminicenantes bacterium]